MFTFNTSTNIKSLKENKIIRWYNSWLT